MAAQAEAGTWSLNAACIATISDFLSGAHWHGHWRPVRTRGYARPVLACIIHRVLVTTDGLGGLRDVGHHAGRCPVAVVVA